ncbi:MarR family transcriptional regulator [Roseovarius sp. CAU 1744]|uniref:MarR family winged helix-turn-helix transcriptional regulator n=1 Tax=Roseovarius sp. CAU 1744 TaxID=3140368 RepID=UPI00325AB309
MDPHLSDRAPRREERLLAVDRHQKVHAASLASVTLGAEFGVICSNAICTVFGTDFLFRLDRRSNKIMSDQIKDLHHAVTTLMRVLKIAETDLQVEHRALNFLPVDIQSLRFVAEHPECRLSDLAKYLGVVPTTASSVVDRLVERGFIERRRPASDRRSIALSLTDLGREVFDRLEAEERMTMLLMLEALPEEERADFVRQMMRIAETVLN